MVLLGLAMLICPLHVVLPEEMLRLSVTPVKSIYSVGEDIEVIVSLKGLFIPWKDKSYTEYLQMSRKELEEYDSEQWMLFPLLLFCEGPYLSFHFAEVQPARITPKVEHTETDFDLVVFYKGDELQQSINLNACYQLSKGRYMLHAVYDTTGRKAVCDTCTATVPAPCGKVARDTCATNDHDVRILHKVWSGTVQSESITIEIVE